MFKPTEYDKKVYETELKDFLPKEFIDCHIHVWEKDMPRHGKKGGGSTWPSKVSEDLTAEDLLEDLRTLFPENKVTPLVFGGCSYDIPTLNEYVREKSEKLGFPTLYRTNCDMTAEFLEKEITDGGFIGIKPYLNGRPSYIPAKETRIYDYLPKEHLEVCDKHGWIVMLHIPRDKRLRDEVNLAQLMEIERDYPNLKLIVAHIGRAYAKEDIGDAFEILKNTKNMVFDFTANVCDDAIEACIKAIGTKRLLFGSDLPIAFMRMYRIVEDGVYYNIIPRGIYGDVTGEAHMRETDETDVTIMIYEQIRALKRVAEKLGLTKEDVEDIMYGNAKRLIEGTKG